MRKVDETAEEQTKIRHRKKMLLVSAALGIIFISVYGWWQKTVPAEMTPLPAPIAASRTQRKPAHELVVYVSGQVKHPGVLKISPGARVIDAINAAGGLAEGAEVQKINLAQAVKDGMQIHVPGSLSAPPTGASGQKAGSQRQDRRRRDSTVTQTETEKVNINTAEEAELDKLPGIGPSLAARIVEWRKSNGLFRDGADLKKVPGVGEAKYQKFKDRITW